VDIWKAVVLGIVEGVTEFLPVSSTGHLTVTEKLLDLKVDDQAVTAFTAVIQVGAIIAAIIYFARDIVRFVKGLVLGLFSPDRRGEDFRLGCYVVIGSIPIGVVGLLGRHLVTGPLRSLWVVAVALIVWSGVMVFSEHAATQQKGEGRLNLVDAVVIGLTQCLALVPGVSRSGATISAGLLRDLDRVTATRLSFFLGIPALVAAGAFELKDAVHGNSVGVPALAVGTLVSLVVAYASIAWLLRFVVRHSLRSFVWYRVLLGLGLIAALSAGWLTAT
jgi:undecaprenyl-diphosphatase